MSMNPERERMIEWHMEQEKMLGGQGPEGRYTREQAEAAVDSAEKHAPISLPKGVAKMLNSEDLKALNEDAIRRNYNRALAEEFVADLDPEGTHVVGPIIIPHEHAQGKKVDPHMRVQLLVKRRNVKEAATVFLDMTIDNFYALQMVAKNEQTGEWEDVTPEVARERLLHQIVSRDD